MLALLALSSRAPASPADNFTVRATGLTLIRAAAAVEKENPDGYHGFCTGDGFLKSDGALALYIPTVLVMFVGLAIVTDDYFVPALEAICEQLSLSEDVAGATFMAAGSSAPELFASLLAVFVTEDDVGVGTIVGSAVFNILVIIGLSAALAGAVLKLDWRSLARDSTFYIISIIGLIIVLMGPSRGQISWWEGLCMVFVYVAYILFMAFGNKPYMAATARFVDGAEKSVGDDEESALGEGKDANPASESGVTDLSGLAAFQSKFGEAGEDVNYRSLTPRAQFRTAYLAVVATNRLVASSSNEELHPQNTSSAGVESDGGESGSEEEGKTFCGIELPEGIIGKIFFPVTFVWSLLFKGTILQCGKPGKGKFWPITFCVSILWIGAISYALVESARMIGCLVGIPSVVMGLTVLAAGTSVPDALASVAVAKMGQADMAVSNAIGSNVFDIAALGLSWFLGSLIKGENQLVTVDPLTTVIVPIVILFAIIVLLIGVLIAMRWQLRPALGYVLFATYFLFVAYQLLDNFVF